jgi:hypothetical protein
MSTCIHAHDHRCFNNGDDMGADAGTQAQNFTMMGGYIATGVTSLCTVPPPAGPQAMHLPGGTISSYARAWNFTFPSTSFTVEGFIKVAAGSQGRFMFSYNQNNNDNCILVRSTVGTYGVWVHWAMTVDMSSSGAITHYLNGSLSILPRDSSAFCGNQGGALVLGQDQDSHLGQFDPNQVRCRPHTES